MNDLVTSVIRTIVPSIVGAVGAFFASKGINVTEEQLATLVPALTTVFTGVYYLTARYLESKYSKAGLLLGSQKKPNYEGSK